MWTGNFLLIWLNNKQKAWVSVCVCVCVCVCALGTAGLQWHWTWADNLFTVSSGELINKCWVISARSNYPCRWQGECVSTPLHPRPCPEGFELVRKHTHTHTHTSTKQRSSSHTCGVCSQSITQTPLQPLAFTLLFDNELMKYSCLPGKKHHRVQSAEY